MSVTPTPAIALILLLTTVFVAACGGGESPGQVTPTNGLSGQPAEQATPTLVPTATVTPQSTQPAGEAAPTRQPAMESGISSDAQTYIDLVCNYSEDEAETWGEALEQVQERTERYRKNRPPEELREYFEALLTLLDLSLEFVKSKNSGERIGPEPGEDYRAFLESPEVMAVIAVIQEVINRMNPYLAIAVSDANC